jgi:hypothetical protein
VTDANGDPRYGLLDKEVEERNSQQFPRPNAESQEPRLGSWARRKRPRFLLDSPAMEVATFCMLFFSFLFFHFLFQPRCPLRRPGYRVTSGMCRFGSGTTTADWLDQLLVLHNALQSKPPVLAWAAASPFTMHSESAALDALTKTGAGSHSVRFKDTERAA